MHERMPVCQMTLNTDEPLRTYKFSDIDYSSENSQGVVGKPPTSQPVGIND
jgi:hypothetical protein